jgi:hypothetical protein
MALDVLRLGLKSHSRKAGGQMVGHDAYALLLSYLCPLLSSSHPLPLILNILIL